MNHFTGYKFEVRTDVKVYTAFSWVMTLCLVSNGRRCVLLAGQERHAVPSLLGGAECTHCLQIRR